MKTHIEQAYNTASHSPRTGKLYSPSLKWGGWLVTSNGARNSFGSPLYNTKGKAIERARQEARDFGGTVYLFRRNQGACILVDTITS